MEELKEGYTSYSKKPFVKREESASLAQSDCKQVEETNLILKIENRARALMQSVNSIEAITKDINKNLLPQLPKNESEAKADRQPPQGWLECHVADLDHVLYRCGQIYDEVSRLMEETRTEKVGQ